MIRFACPGCGATYSVPDEKANKTGKCPKCQGQFIIPAAETPVHAPPPAPTSADTVEIEPCPGCQARLSVASTDLGLDVECPYCQATYTAVKAGSAASPPANDTLGRKKNRPSSLSEALGSGSSTPSSRKERRPEPDDEPIRSSRRRDEEEADRPSRRNREKRSRGGMVVLNRIGVLSAARICGLIYGIFGLIIGILYGGMIILFSLLGATISAGGGGPNAASGMMMGIGGGICALVMFPVLYAVAGFLSGALGAAVYNLAASRIGGIELELE